MAIDLDFYGNSVHFHSIRLWAFEKGHLQSWQLDVEGSSTCDKGHSFARELWFMSLSNSLSAFLTVEWVHCSGGRSSSLGQLQGGIEQETDEKGKQKRYRGGERERTVSTGFWFAAASVPLRQTDFIWRMKQMHLESLLSLSLSPDCSD